MDARISLVTLVVSDVEASRRFYSDGLGWPTEVFVPGEVLMIRVGERLILSLWDRRGAEKELGTVAEAGGSAPPVVLAHNVATEQAVDEAIATARAAGAAVIAEPVRREWGGYSGYIADPDGYRWEIAYNPDEFAQSLLP